MDSIFEQLNKQFLEPKEKQLIEFVAKACIDVVTEAREQPSPGPYPDEMRGFIGPHQPNYIDWTGNLRGSIGYAVYKDGFAIPGYSSFVSNEGGAKGREVANEASAKYREGITAAVVAGENYALSVESFGYNVITTYCTHLKGYLDEYLKLL